MNIRDSQTRRGPTAGRWGSSVLASLLLAACVSPPPAQTPRAAWRSEGGPRRSTDIATASIGEFPSFRAAERASARYATVGGAMIEGVRRDGRRRWRVEVIGRIGESPRSLRLRLAEAR